MKHAIERLRPEQIHGGECVVCQAILDFGTYGGRKPERLIALGMFLATIESMRKSLCQACSEKIAEEFKRGEKVAQEMERIHITSALCERFHPQPCPLHPKRPMLPAARLSDPIGKALGDAPKKGKKR